MFGIGPAEHAPGGSIPADHASVMDVDLVVDSIDDTDDKAALVYACVRTRTPIITCG